MPAASVGPPADASPSSPLPEPPAPSTATGVVVFSQPARAAPPAASAPARASSVRRVQRAGNASAPRQGLEGAEPALAISQHAHCRIVTGRGYYTTSWVRSRTAEIEPVHRRGVAREQRRGPHERHLVQ